MHCSFASRLSYSLNLNQYPIRGKRGIFHKAFNLGLLDQIVGIIPYHKLTPGSWNLFNWLEYPWCPWFVLSHLLAFCQLMQADPHKLDFRNELLARMPGAGGLGPLGPMGGGLPPSHDLTRPASLFTVAGVCPCVCAHSVFGSRRQCIFCVIVGLFVFFAHWIL